MLMLPMVALYTNLLVDTPALASLHINCKEAITVVLAAYHWAPLWRNKIVRLACDNTAAVAILNKGTTKLPLMMKFLRGLFWLSASYNFRIKAFHVPGASNTAADHVSQLHEGSHLLAVLHSNPQHFLKVPAPQNMLLNAYYFLLGKFSCFG